MFECEVCLPQGRHEYKFLVDGQWKHNHTQVAGACAVEARPHSGSWCMDSGSTTTLR